MDLIDKEKPVLNLEQIMEQQSVTKWYMKSVQNGLTDLITCCYKKLIDL